MNILIAGDYCDNHRVSKVLQQGNYYLLFNQVNEKVKESDISIVNFEFPVVLHEGKPILKCGPNLKGQKSAVDAIRYAGFNVCTLANNHILDQGNQCCLDTVRLLEEAGLKTVGAGGNLEEASSILYMARGEETVAIINCCEHEFSIATQTSAGANPLNLIQQYYKIREAKEEADYVIVIVHGGHEHYQLPSPRMKETYRFFVDVGADTVINHHQHCYSGYEVYKEKPIFYGLGNFLFDWKGKVNSIWNEGYMVSLNFNKGKKNSFVLLPYIQCSDTPSVRLMDKNEEISFYRRISELNSIIDDDKLLKEAHEKWMEKSIKGSTLIFQPYSGRIASALYTRNLLPPFMNKVKKYRIINKINCEAHLDKLRYAVEKM